MNPTPNQITECTDERQFCGWVSVEDSLPYHGQKVVSRDNINREFKCTYFDWNGKGNGLFKVDGYVWEHSNVTHWKPIAALNGEDL